MSTARTSLTPRAGGLLGAGLGVCVLAVALDQRDLLRVGVLLLAVPLLAVVTTRLRHAVRPGPRPGDVVLARRVRPARLHVGQETTVELALHNPRRHSSPRLRLSDRLPASLGGTPRLVVERLAPGARLTASYRLRPGSRGRYPVGPVTLHVDDPFGLVEVVRTVDDAATLVVLPAVAPLTARPGAAVSAGHGPAGSRAATDDDPAGDGTARRAAAARHDDVGTREYRPGDELRRVHWRATARTGSLMVRAEDEPDDDHALVVLDRRADAHTAGSFEWAVHAAASVCAHLASRTHAVRLVAGGDDLPVDVTATGDPAPLLDALADVAVTGHDDLLGPSTPEQPWRHRPSRVVVVLGRPDPSVVRGLAALRPTGTGAVALVAAGADHDATGLEGVRALRAAGWQVAVARAGAPVGEVWAQALAATSSTARTAGTTP